MGSGRKRKHYTFSTVAGEKISSDTVREVRGWALRSFTEDGDQEFAFNDLPVSFIRDPISSQTKIVIYAIGKSNPLT
jgi:catalase